MIEIRACLHCGKPLSRRADESHAKFLVRITCSPSCANSLRRSGMRQKLDIGEFCELWASGKSIGDIATRFRIGKRTVSTYADKYPTPEQRELRRQCVAQRANPRNTGHIKVKSDSLVIHLKLEPTDWTGVRFADDPIAVAADRYGRIPTRPSAFLPRGAAA